MRQLWSRLLAAPVWVRVPPVLLYVVLIFMLGSAKPTGNPPRVNDKLAHGVAFGVLALVAFPALGRRREPGGARCESQPDSMNPSSVGSSGVASTVSSGLVDERWVALQTRGAMAFGFSTSVGAALEMWQFLLPHRSAEWLDLAADGAGALLGASAALWLSATKRYE